MCAHCKIVWYKATNQTKSMQIRNYKAQKTAENLHHKQKKLKTKYREKVVVMDTRGSIPIKIKNTCWSKLC